ncbi:methyltransferase-like protein 2 isoform X1 [Actinidia eriantha]|uniref:methyltransferase-like protein 2 isoform X1 n=1 Tax=Actinidia eriantha TaxID=165200 RepID=UPI002586C59A|nr:methyltransferase-like protein 2 isoform X1 [Actinidia eriantha]
MAESKTSDRLSTFLKSGVYRFEGSHAVFVDPVRVLNRSYTRFRVSPSAYYSRFFESKNTTKGPTISTCSRKRKRKQKKAYTLNERERVADQRHQEVRPLLLKAHEALLAATDLLKFVRNLRSDGCSPEECGDLLLPSLEQSFVELGSVWQAPLYEITLNFPQYSEPTEDGGSPIVQSPEQKVIPMFNNLVINETSRDVETEFLNSKYIMPRKSCFYMSDLGQIHDLVPAESNCGFNFILVDPPWENSSAHQKLKYPTLPNRYFLSLPIRQLTHTGGALLALWVTNREKLRAFVEKELFPSWGVKYMASLYWLKVNADGLLTSELDLFHHRPYECLLVGYCHGGAVDSECLSRFKPIPDSQVFISVPGDYSRKPPIGELLLEYVPGDKPARCIELFAREMIAGWTSWGNEPLHFQESRYFLKTTDA